MSGVSSGSEITETPGRAWKLPLVLGVLAGGAAMTLFALVSVAAATKSPMPVGPIWVDTGWSLAVLGGALGGLARALYAFVVENYAFRFRYKTGRSSAYVQKILRAEDIEDDFDPLDSWYLYPVHSLIGGTLGFSFALAVDFGLVTLGGNIDHASRPVRLVVVASLGGLFAESALHRLRNTLANLGAAP